MLCHFANSFPVFVENFLGRGRLLARRFREETITDLMMGSLISLGAGRVIVEFPNEPITGGDMQWDFVNIDDGTFFRILLQAKVAYGNGRIWSRHCYKELFHTVGATPKLQVKTLCDTARKAVAPTYPLHIFYNPQQTCALARAAGGAHVIGVTLADSYLIEHLADATTSNPRLRTRNRSLGVISPYFFPLTKLFCPPSILPRSPFAFSPRVPWGPFYLGSSRGRMTLGVPIPPTPSEVRGRLVEMRSLVNELAKEEIGQNIPPVPNVANVIPDEVQAVIGGDTNAVPSEGLKRWKVTFVASSPPEDGGAPIRPS